MTTGSERVHELLEHANRLLDQLEAARGAISGDELAVQLAEVEGAIRAAARTLAVDGRSYA
jgi:hypothetical protein